MFILLPIKIAVYFFSLFLQKLNVPAGFSVTSPDKRNWFISPFGDKQPFPTWMMGASVVPALLVFILIFMETQITSYVQSQYLPQLLYAETLYTTFPLRQVDSE